MKRNRVLAAIALFRLAKAVALILIGFGVLHLLRPEVAAHLRDSLRSLPFAVKYVPTLTDRRHIELVAAAAFAYAGLFTVEGIGLWMQKRWAEYLTIIATSSFLPFELLELVKKLTILRVGLVMANSAVVAYLIALLRRQHRLGGSAG